MFSQGLLQRLQDLEQNIVEEQKLLNEFEEVLRYENNPRIKAGYRHEIERQRQSVASYQQEYKTLQQELADQYPIQMQEVGSQLQEMDVKLDLLLGSQVVIYEDLNQMRQTFLDCYNANEKKIVCAVVQDLSEAQLALTQKLVNAVETNQVTQLQMKQMLVAVEERLPSLPPSQAATVEFIKDPELDAKHKLKVTLPLVPLLVNYEGELELGSGVDIKAAWEKLINKLRRK